jgi:hypothetical protein
MFQVGAIGLPRHEEPKDLALKQIIIPESVKKSERGGLTLVASGKEEENESLRP